MKRKPMGDLRKDVPVIISRFEKEGYRLKHKKTSRISRSTYLTFEKKYIDTYGDNDIVDIIIRVSDHDVGQHYNSHSGQIESYQEPTATIRIDYYLINYSLDAEIEKAISECADYFKENAI